MLLYTTMRKPNSYFKILITFVHRFIYKIGERQRQAENNLARKYQKVKRKSKPFRQDKGETNYILVS